MKNYLKEFNYFLEKYKDSEIVINNDDLKENIFSYIYHSNKLEGNSLTLLQTKSILETNSIFFESSNKNVSLHDILEVKGQKKAIDYILKTSLENTLLSVDIIKEINKKTLSYIWEDDSSYYELKKHGQELGEYKKFDNTIFIKNKEQKIEGNIKPLSNPYSIKDNMEKIVNEYNNDKRHIIEKIADISYKIFINQPFADGNKRTARLVSTFESIKENIPFIPYKSENTGNFNDALIQVYKTKDINILEMQICNEYISFLKNKLELNKNEVEMDMKILNINDNKIKKDKPLEDKIV